MSEETKEKPIVDDTKEGLTIKKKPKKLVPKSTEDIKVDLTKTKEDAVQTQETNDSNAIVEEKTDETSSEKVVEEVRATEEKVETPIVEEIKEEVKETTQELKEAIRDEKVTGKPLPENIEKLVSFMEETGGTVEDYVNLNKDYTSYDEKSLLNEYYKRTKPHLNQEEIMSDYKNRFESRKNISKGFRSFIILKSNGISWKFNPKIVFPFLENIQFAGKSSVIWM